MKKLIPIASFTPPNEDIEREIINRSAKYVLVEVLDPRNISPIQRMKARAIIGDVANFTGQPADYLHEYFKYDFCTMNDEDFFSLSDVNVTTARLYITYLIEFCLRFDVPLSKNLQDVCDDLDAATYLCVKHRSCIVCGTKKCDIHHVNAVGMGANRRKIVHEGLSVMPLCRAHHSEAHSIGNLTFSEKYHTQAVKLDKYLCVRLGLNFEAN